MKSDGNEIDYANISNILISFDSDYTTLFSADHYISHRELDHIKTYIKAITQL